MGTEKLPSTLELKLNSFVVTYLTRIPFVSKIHFVEHLHTMLHAGLSLTEGLGVLSREIQNRKLRGIIGQVKAGVEQGQPLSEVLGKFPRAFPHIYVKMIAAGEVSGKLEESLKQIAGQMHKTYDLNSSIRGALIYPAVIITAMIGIGIMMVTVVLPKLMTLFDEFGTDLPLATRILLAITDFFSNPLNLTILSLALVLGLTSFIYSLRHFVAFRRLVHNFNLRLPIFGQVIKKINLARFSLTLSSLLKSAIQIIEAIQITAETCSNLIYQEKLKQAAERIKTGTPLSEILGESPRIFPPMVTEMIMVGEKSGEVNQLLDELSSFYSQEVDKTMKNFATIIEPVIIIILGLAVAGLAVAVVMPMFTLVQNF
ncbi:MAG TPA: type II secretion system F family protein [Patescibacteria group bacterium]|nr:type II secretion system F family protein [Patescibacteria group bacterium]